MANPLHFISHSRRGVATGTAVPAGTHGIPDDGRLYVQRTFTITSEPSPVPGQPGTDPAASAPLAVYGPGDVVGVEAAQIVRRHPVPGDANLEPNYLAGIEFAHPDLPWMFSPESTDGATPQPWLMLIVLATTPGVPPVRSVPGSPCPVITVGQAGQVPDPKDAWAFAHVQVFDADNDDLAKSWVQQYTGFEPRLRSRLLCPTRLAPNTGYVAALVPTYELGRLAGLGIVPDNPGLGKTMWSRDNNPDLPVYDSWQFRTGPAGDFETLARKLHRAPADIHANLGNRNVVVEPGAALLSSMETFGGAAGPGVYTVPTAIVRVAETEPEGQPASKLAPDHLPAEARAVELHRVLKGLLNQVGSADGADPLVGPPLYGQWPAQVRTLDGENQIGEAALADVETWPGSRQGWIEQLNADPFQRMAAGLGVQTVQRDQEELMKDAWLQLEDVEAANHRTRWSALYASMATVLHRKVSSQDEQAILRFLSPAAGRLRDTPEQTYRATLEASVVAPQALSPAFIRSARYAVRAAGRTLDPGAARPTSTEIVGSVVKAMQTDSTQLQPSRFSGARTIDPNLLTDLVHDARFEPRLTELLGEPAATYLQRASAIPQLLESLANQVVQPAGPAIPVVPAPGHGIHLHGHGIQLQGHQLHDAPANLPVDLPAGGPWAGPVLKVQDFTAAQWGVFQHPDIVTEKLNLGDRFASEATTFAKSLHVKAARTNEVASVLGLMSAAQESLGVAQLDLGSVLGDDPAASGLIIGGLSDGLKGHIADLDTKVALPGVTALATETVNGVLAKFEPTAAYAKMLAYAATFDPSLVRLRIADPFSPAMASPLFPAPAVERLKKLDEKWILGGVELLPENSVCVLAVNWKFVESYLAGSNHEMARELLWRRYPTDLRGTCFRRFWAGPGDDIATMDRWAGVLGTHGAAATGVAAPYGRKEVTVLVLKGDLLRRYPNTIISAVKGYPTPDNQGDAFTATESRQELFRGFLSRDVSYVGLDLAPSDLKWSEAGNPKHTWYIQLLEPHNEPRFGLDEKAGAEPNTNMANPSVSPAPPAPPDPYGNSDNWSWQGLPSPASPPAPGLPLQLEPNQVMAANSAAVAANLFQRPFRLLVLASDYI